MNEPSTTNEETLEDARRALRDLAAALGRMTAEAAFKLRIDIDMSDPEVAKEMMLMALEACFSKPPKASR